MLTKDQALQKIQELQTYIQGMDEMVCPIKIERHTLWDGDDLAILFNDNKQALGYDTSHGGIYCVDISGDGEDKLRHVIPCKLVPVDVKDLIAGNTYFHTNENDMQEESKILKYCKYLGERQYIYADEGGNTTKSNSRRIHRYSVQAI